MSLVAPSSEIVSATSVATFSGRIGTRGFFAVHGDARQWFVAEFWRRPSPRQRRAVVARLAEERPDFVLSTGDLVAVGSDSRLWRRFDAENAPLRESGVAFFAAVGNHDLWWDGRRGLANLFARFPHLGGRRWYGVRYGALDVVVLDSTKQHSDGQEEWYRERLAQDEADPTVRGVLVAFHHPPYTNTLLRGRSAWVRERFVEPARSFAKVRAFFTSHVHSYEHFVVDGVHFVVSGGGGGPLMRVPGPRGEYRDLYDGERSHHFCRVTPRTDDVLVEVVMLGDGGTWRVADEFAIGLTAPARSSPDR